MAAPRFAGAGPVHELAEPLDDAAIDGFRADLGQRGGGINAFAAPEPGVDFTPLFGRNPMASTRYIQPLCPAAQRALGTAELIGSLPNRRPTGQKPP